MIIQPKQTLTGRMNMADALRGPVGVTFTPEVDEAGNLSWTNDGGLPNPEPVNIRGPKGDVGEPEAYDAMMLVLETGLVSPATNENGAFYTDGADAIYTL